MNPKNGENQINKLTKPWTENTNGIWLASTVSLFRNFEQFKFPEKMSPDRRKQIIPLVKKEFLASEELSSPFFVNAEDVPPEEREYLVEHFLSTYTFQDARGGEGFILDTSGKFLATINIHDHLHLHMIDIHGELERTWNQLVKIEMHLGQTIAYAFSPEFGFLTSNASFCGTGLVVSFYLQLAALIHTGKIDEVIEKYSDKGISITGIQGSPDEIIGDILTVRNQYTLGLNEENIISSLRAFATKLMVEEKSCRAHVKESGDSRVKDKVSRAFGVLVHSYEMEAVEALNAISLMKLGSELGWLDGVKTADLNALLFSCRRGHLSQHFNEPIDQDELPHKRAEYIHEVLRNSRLLI